MRTGRPKKPLEIGDAEREKLNLIARWPKSAMAMRTLAANELKNSSVSTAVVAETVGYQSEAAFQRVFKQPLAMTPARWRRAPREPDPSTA